jgi:hypothetical protein
MTTALTTLQENYRTQKDGEGYVQILYNDKIIGHVITDEEELEGKTLYYGELYGKHYSYYWRNSPTEVVQKIIKTHQDLIKPKIDESGKNTGYRIVRRGTTQFFDVLHNGKVIGVVDKEFDDTGPKPYYGSILHLPTYSSVWGNSITEVIKQIIQSHRAAILPISDLFNLKESNDSEHDKTGYHIVNSTILHAYYVYYSKDEIGYVYFNPVSNFYNGIVMYPDKHINIKLTYQREFKDKKEAIKFIIDQFEFYKRMGGKRGTPISESEESKYSVVKKLMGAGTNPVTFVKYYGIIIGSVAKDSENSYAYYPVSYLDMLSGSAKSEVEAISKLINLHTKFLDNPKTKIDKLDESKYIAKPVRYKPSNYSANNTEKIALFKDSEYIGMITFDPRCDMYQVFLSTKRIGTANSRSEGFQLIIKARNEYEKSQNITENTDNPKFTISKDLTYSRHRNLQVYIVFCDDTRIGMVLHYNGTSSYESNYFGPGMRSINTTLKSIKNAIQFIIDKYRQNTEKKLDENKKNTKFTVVNATYKDSNQIGLYIVRANEHDIGDIRLFIEKRDNYYGRGHWSATFYANRHRHRHMNTEKLSDAVDFIIGEYKLHKKLASDQKVSESQKRMGPKIRLTTTIKYFQPATRNYFKKHVIYFDNIKIGEIHRTFGETGQHFNTWLYYVKPSIGEYFSSTNQKSTLYMMIRSENAKNNFQDNIQLLIDKAKEIGRIPKESSDEITEDTKGYNVEKFEFNSTGVLHGDGKNYWYDKEIVYKVMFGKKLIGYVTTVYELNTLLTLDGNPYLYNNITPNENIKPVNAGRTDNLNKAMQAIIDYHKNKGRKKANKLKESALYTKQIKTSVVWSEVESLQDRNKKEQCILFHIGKTLIGSVVSYYNENNTIEPIESAIFSYVLGGNHFYVATAKGRWLPDSRKGGLLCKTLKEATDYVIDTYLKYKIGIEHE